MGAIQIITCNNCKRNWQCKTGCGILHSRIDFAARDFPEDTARQIRAEAALHPHALFRFGYQVTGCPHCKNIVSVPVLSMRDTDSTYIGPCPECGGTVQPENVSVCPVCGRSELSVREVGMWD